MQIRRHDSTRETELQGTADELMELARKMTSPSGRIELDHFSDPAPFARMLSYLDVARTTGSVMLSCHADSDTLNVRGGGSQLSLFAENIYGFAEAGNALAHLHIDYFPGHFYLDESTDSMVIALFS